MSSGKKKGNPAEKQPQQAKDQQKEKAPPKQKPKTEVPQEVAKQVVAKQEKKGGAKQQKQVPAEKTGSATKGEKKQPQSETKGKETKQEKQPQQPKAKQTKEEKPKAQTQVKSEKKKEAKKKKAPEKKKPASAKKQTPQKKASTKKTPKKDGAKSRGKSKSKTTKGGDVKKDKLKFRLRNTRQRGRQTGNEKLWEKLRPTEDDVLKMLAAQVHIGPARAHANMQRYVFERRKDGLAVINLDKTWHKMILAARILATVQNPADIMVMSTRTYGQRGAIKFAHYTGATPMVGKWIPGTFCNPRNKAFAEPRLLLVDDPATCFAALRETSYVGIPVIALCGVNNNTRFVDCAVPCNNRGKLSLGLMFWLLAREVLRIKKEIPRDKPWDAAPVDLFFYRNPDKIKKAQEEKKKQELEQSGQGQQEYYEEQGADFGAGRGDFGIEQIQTWEQEPPRPVLEDWAAADVMIDQSYSGQQFENEEQDDGQIYGSTEEQAFGRVRMQQW